MIASLPKDSSSYEILSRVTPAQLISSPDLIEALDSVKRRLVLGEVMKSFKDIFCFCMGLAVLSIACGIFVTNKRIPDDVATKDKSGKEDVDDDVAKDKTDVEVPKAEQSSEVEKAKVEKSSNDEEVVLVSANSTVTQRWFQFGSSGML